MSIQWIVSDTSVDLVCERLGEIARQCEIFPVGDVDAGLSVPSKLLGPGDDDKFRERLRGLMIYDLYAGKWMGR